MGHNSSPWTSIAEVGFSFEIVSNGEELQWVAGTLSRRRDNGRDDLAVFDTPCPTDPKSGVGRESEIPIPAP